MNQINDSLDEVFYNFSSDDEELSDSMNQTAAADFIAFDPQFLSVLGSSATLERIYNFTDGEEKHVHEAPVYVPDTNELLFSTTTAIGWLWALDLETLQVRNLTCSPPLSNVNGGTYHAGKAYFVTNGSPVRGVYEVDYKTGDTIPVVNNFRGRRLNSPNDVIFDSQGNMWFTDPGYGYWSEFAGVQDLALPQSIYFFNTTSSALLAVSNHVVQVPNGLAFSPGESTLYVADSADLQGRPMGDASPGGIRNVWALDITSYPMVAAPRLVHQVEVGWPDGMRVSQGGLVIVGVWEGADVIDPATGRLLGKINCPGDIIYNVERIAGTGTWLLSGAMHIYRFTIAEKSLPLAG